MLRLLQFTDLHLRDDPDGVVRGVRTQHSFEAVIYHARRHRWPADGVLLTGDLANDEFNDSYRRLAATAAGWDVPLLAVPGNHDDAAALSAAFAELPKAGERVLDFARWRVVALDSQVPRAVHGALDDDELRLLEDAAETRGDRHLLVGLHHPPLPIESAWLDRIGLHGGDAFRMRLAALGVRGCVFGHAHQAWDSIDNGVRYLGTPSTGPQMQPRSDEYMESDDPPGYRWLHLHDDGRIESGVAWVNDYRQAS